MELAWKPPKATPTAITSSTFIRVPPVSNLQDKNANLVFQIEKSNAVLDLTDTFLYLKLKIIHSDGTGVKLKKVVVPQTSPENEGAPAGRQKRAIALDNEFIGPVDNFIYSMFSCVSLYISDQKVSRNTEYLPYIIKILSMTNLDQRERDTELWGALADPYELSRHDNFKFTMVGNEKIESEQNNALMRRATKTYLSKTVRNVLTCVDRLSG